MPQRLEGIGMTDGRTDGSVLYRISAAKGTLLFCIHFGIPSVFSAFISHKEEANQV